jgi:hypothetical protein
VHDALLKKPSPGMLKAKLCKAQIIYKSLGVLKPKDLNRIAKIDFGHIYLREEYFSFYNNYMILRNCKY